MRTHKNTNHRHAPMSVGPISIEQAMRDGLSPSFLRTVANSLERIAKSGYRHARIDGMDTTDPTLIVIDEPAYDFNECRRNARILRGVARQLELRR